MNFGVTGVESAGGGLRRVALRREQWRGGQFMNSGVCGVESAGGGLRRVALRRETVARWTVYERWGEWCGVCRGGDAEGGGILMLLMVRMGRRHNGGGRKVRDLNA